MLMQKTLLTMLLLVKTMSPDTIITTQRFVWSAYIHLPPPYTSNHVSDHNFFLSFRFHFNDVLMLISLILRMTAFHSFFFFIALFSALEQTHCAHWHVILNE